MQAFLERVGVTAPDGVTETRDSSGAMIQEQGFRQLISDYSERDAPARLGAIVNTLRHMEMRDDTTILMLERCRQ